MDKRNKCIECRLVEPLCTCTDKNIRLLIQDLKKLDKRGRLIATTFIAVGIIGLLISYII